jgi:replicative DNA helicase
MVDIYATIEDQLITHVVQSESAVLSCIRYNIKADFFENTDNADLFKIVMRYYKEYQQLPQAADLLLFTTTATTITEAQRTQTPLFFQEVLVRELPPNSVDVLLLQFIKKYKAKQTREALLAITDKLDAPAVDSTLASLLDRLALINKIGTNDEIKSEYTEDGQDRLHRYNRIKNKEIAQGLHYGYPTLSKYAGGHDSKTLWVVRGGPKAGKSTFMINCANHVCKQGKNIVYFSAEVSRDVIERRLDALNLDIPISDIKYGTLEPGEEARYKQYVEDKNKKYGKFIIVDKATMTTDYIAATVQDIRQDTNIDLIVVDYLGLIKLQQKVESRWIEVGEVSKALRALAQETNVPVLTAQQVNRAGETANAHEIDRTCDLLLDLSRDNPDEEVISGAVIQITATIVYSRDSGLGQFPIDAQFAFGKMTEPVAMFAGQ